MITGRWCMLLIYVLSVAAWAFDTEHLDEIRMYAGDIEILEAKAISDVAIGNSEVVTATALPGRGVMLTARAAGETSLHLWRDGVKQSYFIYVQSENLTRIRREVSALIGSIPGVSILEAGNRVIVDGVQVTAFDRRKITRLLAAYPGVINMLDEKGADSGQMVYMDVRIIELSRNGVTSLGVDWADDMAGPAFAIAGDLKRSSGFQKGMLPELASVPAMSRVSPFQSYFGVVTRLDSRISLLEQSGDALMVAHPILSCRNLGKASFLSGGQVPIATASATGTPSVEFKDYGIKLDIEPTLGEQDAIFAHIAAEVSDLDKSTTVNGVPGLLSRKTETEFTMKLGETIVLSGLVNRSSGKAESAVPGLGHIPGLGWLFKSRSRTDRRNELVIFVTPMIRKDMEPPLTGLQDVARKLIHQETADTLFMQKAGGAAARQTPTEQP